MHIGSFVGNQVQDDVLVSGVRILDEEEGDVLSTVQVIFMIEVQHLRSGTLNFVGGKRFSSDSKNFFFYLDYIPVPVRGSLLNAILPVSSSRVYSYIHYNFMVDDAKPEIELCRAVAGGEAVWAGVKKMMSDY
jgi:hypothetical protein